MPADLIQRLTLHGGVIPGFVATVLLSLLWLRNAKWVRAHPGSEGDGPRWLLPLLVAMGFIVADWVAKQSLDLWPRDNTKRALHAAVLLGIVGGLEGLVRLPQWVAWIARAVAFSGLTWMLVEGYAPQTISTPEMWGWVVVAALLGPLMVAVVDRSIEHTPGWRGLVPLLGLAVGGLAVFKPAGFAFGSMAMIGAVAVLSAAVLVSVVAPRLNPARGSVTVVCGLILAGVWGAGIQSEPKSFPALILISASPLAVAWRAECPWRTLIVRLAAIGVVVGAAGGLLAWEGRWASNSSHSEQGTPADYGY